MTMQSNHPIMRIAARITQPLGGIVMLFLRSQSDQLGDELMDAMRAVDQILQVSQVDPIEGAVLLKDIVDRYQIRPDMIRELLRENKEQ